MGFVDIYRFIMGWWSSTGSAPDLTPSAFTAFSAPVHAAFGTRAESTKGHTAFGDEGPI